MKKIIALILSIVILCSLSVTAFAAESPVAEEIVSFVAKKAKIVSIEVAGDDATEDTEVEDIKLDVEYSFRKGTKVGVTADSSYGTFKSWSIYKVEEAITTTSVSKGFGLFALNAATNLTATTKYVEAVEGVDYEIVEGSLTEDSLTVMSYSEIVICGNYNKIKTNPSKSSSVTEVAFEVKKADVIEVTGKDGDSNIDTEYVLDGGTKIIVRANKEYGTFKGWSIYNVDNELLQAVEGVDYKIVSGGIDEEEMTIVTYVSTVICADYDDLYTNPEKPSTEPGLTTKPGAIQTKPGDTTSTPSGTTSTPSDTSSQPGDTSTGDKTDDSDSAPKTSDMTALYAVIIMLGAVAFAFGTKKVYSK